MDTNTLRGVREGIQRNRGSLKRVVEKTGFSREYVRLVLRGKRNNERLLLEATRVLKEIVEEKKEVKLLTEEMLKEANKIERSYLPYPATLSN